MCGTAFLTSVLRDAPYKRIVTSACCSDVSLNHLTGTLPAALGALTDLVVLCGRPPQALRHGDGPARPPLRRVGVLTRVRCCAATWKRTA
jgi:hypothetical protein